MKPGSTRIAVDLAGEMLGMLKQEVAQGRVVGHRVWANEFGPGTTAALEPRIADQTWLSCFNRSRREARLTLGDLRPHEGGCLLPFPVVHDRLEGPGNSREVLDDLLPEVQGQAPVPEDKPAVLVVDQSGGGIQFLVRAGARFENGVLVEREEQAA
ncbi:hypothetical protein [Kitasatospora sp. NPDC047058]|uniref:hypothetical protein n=1 Tax=Kitasatospora sp. NPDC047058 TaxID=3155620 RepID=UPI0033C6C06B